MELRILDLDGSLPPQHDLLSRFKHTSYSATNWGPQIRLACSFRRFQGFERELGTLLGRKDDPSPALTVYGSGDFHHVSLALLRRLPDPFNLLVLDNHPDWMRRVPLLHCGTWLYHAACLPNVRHVFHVGGEQVMIDADGDTLERHRPRRSRLEHLPRDVAVARRALRDQRLVDEPVVLERRRDVAE